MSLSVHICERTLNSSRSNQLGLREDGRPLKRILIVKLSSLGDVVMTLPSLMALRNSFPQAKIDWMVEPANVDILSTHPMINSLLVSTRPEALKL
ncbi:MAG: hypothetical protein LBV23_04425, partial [Deltaproteobacteria bacterium]|nr:hypothetical protein [Deltaproteobacteria bacterium]